MVVVNETANMKPSHPSQQKKKNRRRGRTSNDKNGGNHKDDETNPSHHQIVAQQRQPSPSPSSNSHHQGNSSSLHHSSDDKIDGNSSVVITPHSTILIPVMEENEFWFHNGLFGPVTSERDATIIVASTTTNTVVVDTTTKTSKSPQQTQPNPPHIIGKYRTMADQMYRNEIMLFNHQQKNSNGGGTANSTAAADTSFLEHTISRGTLKDKIAAMSVLISTYPIHKLYILDSLLSMVGCQSHNANPTNAHSNGNYKKSMSHSTSNTTTTNARVVQMAAEALEDLFIHTLLPKDRKLVTLQQRPLLLYENNNNNNQVQDDTTDGNNTTKKKRNHKKTSHGATTKRTLSPRILLLWRYEEMIKERYDMFLRHYIARTLSNDIPTSISASTTSHGSTKASTSSTSNGINLDGPKIAALRTGAALLRTVPEGETYLLPLLVNKLGDPKATICSVTSHELRKILHLHPSMVHIMAREVQQLVHRPHLSINAIYNCITFLNQLKLVRSTNHHDHDDPYAVLAVSLMNTYFRLFDIAIQPPPPKQQQPSSSHSKGNTTNKKETNDVHQSRLLSALLTGVNRAHPYLPPPSSTVSKNNSKNPANVSAILDEHIDALYRVVHTAPPAARTQSLLLLYHIAVGNHSTTSDNSGNGIVTDTTRQDRFYRALYATLADPNMVGTGKHVTMYFNLLYKAMKSDHSETNAVRLISYTKRLWSTALHCSSSVLAAVLFLIDTIAHDHHPFLYTCYRTILTEQDALRVLDPTKREPRGALVVLNDDRKKNSNDASGDTKSAHSEILAPGWELALTNHHYHPSVKKFSEMFASDMSGIGSNYTGDPLRDFALAPFLDKFAYRNPKTVEHRAKGETATNALDDDEAPATVMEKFSHSVGARRQRQTDQLNQPLNDPSFIESSNVNEDDVFFHKFFVERAKRDAMKGIVRNKSQNNKDTNVDDDDAEIAAIDRAESRNADQSNVSHDLDEDYDTWDQWETDDEEEEFVDSLAQQIIEDSMEGNAIDDLDDEDPDTEGWDDLHDDGDPNEANDDENDHDEEMDSENDDDAFEDENDVDVDVDVDDTDAFMDQDDDSDSSQERLSLESNEEMFDNNVSDDDDDDEEEDAAIFLAEEEGDHSDVDDIGGIDDDDDDDDDPNFADMLDNEENDEDDEDDDDEAPELLKLPIPGNKSKNGVFAAAEDYADLVEKSWNAQKRHYTSWDDEHQNENDLEENDDDNEDDTVPVRKQPPKENGSKKKRRKRTP